jgi:hypothetical protein
MCGHDPEDETGDRRIFANVKMNIAAEPPSLIYHLVYDELHGVARVGWLGTSEHRAADLLSEHDDQDDRSERDEGADWLTGYLTEQGGEAAFADVLKAGRANGHSERTLRRARSRAGAETTRYGFPSRTVWRLPVRPQSGHSGQDSEAGRTGRTVAALDEGQDGSTDGWTVEDTPLPESWPEGSFGEDAQ